MGILSRLFNTEKKTENRDLTYQEMVAVGGWVTPHTHSGVVVNDATAYGLSALWCGIRTISQDLGTLEPQLFEQDKDGNRTLALEHPVYTLIAEEPNEEMTRPVFFETMMAHALLGNAYAEIERNKQGEPIALWPINPNTVTVRRGSAGLEYVVNNVHGQFILEAENVLHIPGLGPDGSAGYKLLTIARESLGFGIACMRFGASHFGNAARPGGVIQAPAKLDDSARANITKGFRDLYSGPDNAGRNILLEEGMTWNAITQTNEQTQYKDMLTFIVYEVARLLIIPPTKLMDLQKATWANVAQFQQEYYTSCLRPWLIKWEHELQRKLLTKAERKTYYIEFDVSSVLRADIESRAAWYQIARANNILTVDEIRAELNLPPMAEEDKQAPKAELIVAPPSINIPPEAAQPVQGQYGNTLI